jgi:hypothetical protein
MVLSTKSKKLLKASQNRQIIVTSRAENKRVLRPKKLPHNYE